LLSTEFHTKYIIQALKDRKIWINSLIGIGAITPLYSISLFLPTIVKELGYSSSEAQLLTMPPYVFACICTVTASYFADKAGQRGVILLGFEGLAIFGFVFLAASAKPHVQYAGTFFAAAGMLAFHITLRNG
jgi:MFS family permease